MKNLKSLLIGLLFLAVGTLFVVLGKGDLEQGFASKSWPVVQGKVVQSKVTSYKETSHKKGRTRTTTMYSPQVTYTYAVDGQRYTGDRVMVTDSSSSSYNIAKQIVGRYPAGSLVDVHYDPQNPREAVLEPGTNMMSYLPFGLGLLAALVGLGMSLKSAWRLFVKFLRMAFYLVARRG